jgi:hypothetical protein
MAVFELIMADVSLMDVDPDIPESANLHQWWQQTGTSISFAEVMAEGDESPPVVHLRLIKDLNLGSKDTSADYVTVYCTLADVSPDRLTYAACPNPHCNGRHLLGDRGNYSCNRCKGPVPNPILKFALKFRVTDFSGSATMTAVEDDSIGKLILGVTPEEWQTRLEQSGTAATIKELANVNVGREFKVKCRVKQESRTEGRSWTTLTAMTVEPVDYSEATRFFNEETVNLPRAGPAQVSFHGHLSTLPEAV